MTNLYIIITMAGSGERFKKAGYQQPKYMVEAKGFSLFYWSLLSLNNFNKTEAEYIFIVRKEDNAFEFIALECQKLSIKSYSVVEIDELTDGQATTVLLAEPYIKNHDIPFVVYNIDTHVDPEFINPKDFKKKGWIPCFAGQGDKWSFVKTDKSGKVVEVREKTRISDNATIGLYGFPSFKVYRLVYESYYSKPENIEKGERYIAPLYNQLIKDGIESHMTLVPFEAVIPLGTPEDLDLFLRQDNEPFLKK